MPLQRATVFVDGANVADDPTLARFAPEASASGDATLRLIAADKVQPVNTALVPNYADIFAGLKDKPWNTVDGVEYGLCGQRWWATALAAGGFDQGSRHAMRLARRSPRELDRCAARPQAPRQAPARLLMRGVLHILTAPDDALARVAIEQGARAGERVTVVCLPGAGRPALPPGVAVRRLPEELSYDGLLALIFEADDVLTW